MLVFYTEAFGRGAGAWQQMSEKSLSYRVGGGGGPKDFIV